MPFKCLIRPALLMWAVPCVSTFGSDVFTTYYNIVLRPGFQWLGHSMSHSVFTITNLVTQPTNGTVAFELIAPEAALPALSVENRNRLSGFFGSLLIKSPELVTLELQGGFARLSWHETLYGSPLVQDRFEALRWVNSPEMISLTNHAFFSAAGPPLNSSNLLANTFTNAWQDPAREIPFGSAVLVYHPGVSTTMTIIGEGKFGVTTNNIPPGFSFVASPLPAAGKLTRDLKLVLSTGDFAFRAETNGVLKSYVVLPGGQWSPEEPILQTGEGFMLYTHQPITWTRELRQ